MADHKFARGLKRGELAQRTGSNSETIRYYEKIGLLPEPPRNSSDYRIYDETHVRRLRFVLRGRELGFNIEEIRGLLRPVDGDRQTRAEVRTRTEHQLYGIRDKIADIRLMKTILANGPLAVALCIEAIDRGLEMSLDEGLVLEANHFGLLATTDDMREGMRAFLDKRAPAFKGK